MHSPVIVWAVQPRRVPWARQVQQVIFRQEFPLTLRSPRTRTGGKHYEASVIKPVPAVNVWMPTTSTSVVLVALAAAPALFSAT